MIEKLIAASLKNKLIVLLAVATMAGFGLYSLLHIPIGAVPDVTNNQVQVITTSRNLSTLDVERFLTHPVELEMANLPGLIEIRSISKFGLSVVTLVFEDNMGTWLPRQLIAEKMQAVMENIPEGFGSPFMGPVSTGLGEIYQYILEVDIAHQHLYSTSDLRTIQDWLVKRKLSGIPGVVEVNTWGGHLKQYEVSVNPQLLSAMDISVEEVYSALEKNNSIVGGGYIEKTNQSYFIRSDGLLTSIEAIEQIVVKNDGKRIVKVGDLAEVQIGFATRFGAITANGEGEKVLGQIMMLKNANSNEVISDVKNRVAEISSSLPEGIHINGFLDRSELIEKTTGTIAENLILGCLIVIFVVVLLLGNLRSGLVIASVIPLSLLFALSLMYIFGVDANLMSLGAIDFGIIIDGAVIIVEFIAFQIHKNKDKLALLGRKEQKEMIDSITRKASQKLTRSALFGQLIIIIVFIPILTLTGIEGKMFRPMAQVFSFALLGTMILGFTYVPVVSSMFLKPGSGKPTITDRIMAALIYLYEPSLRFALRFKKQVLIAGGLLLVFSILIFSNIGGEFVPTLDEGDFVIQPVFKTGTSLGETIELTTKIERILLQFPEVNQVVSRIGAAEVPTDPMSMEESDIIITLHPPRTWVTAATKDELAEKFKEALSVIPGIEYEFTQPIEMRFNELITGTRADLAIKIFGEDLELLNKLALRIKSKIDIVEGAADVIVEKTTGLPEMKVNYNRQKLALYGLSIDDVNKVIAIGFGGLKAGELFEGERKFDLVLRYDAAYRKELQHLQQALIPLADGRQIPVSEVADVSLENGPAKISRDNTHRRVVIGVNVRNRDLESVVSEIQTIIRANIQLPEGYTIEYGGQFENLRSARARLMIVIPLALALIFALLHLAFKSIKDVLMIYSAIPLAAVGGILLLWMRGMPFSISAGVGFIALFGIAVLNGIVLIEHFKELEKKNEGDLLQLIITGARERLRPVLLTASAAALGFLPMAISTSAGAEVQRPLATVVIGGLITSTLLTLIILPVLYSIFHRSATTQKRMKPSKTMAIVLLFMMILPAGAQELSREAALQLALENHPELQAAQNKIKKASQEKATAFDLPKTLIFHSFDQNNIADNGLPLKVWGIQQSIDFPAVYSAKRNYFALNQELAAMEELETIKTISREIEHNYNDAAYFTSVYQYYDSICAGLQKMSGNALQQFKSGEVSRLTYLSAEAKYQSLQLLKDEAEAQMLTALHQLKVNLFLPDSINFQIETLKAFNNLPVEIMDSSTILKYELQVEMAQQHKQIVRFQAFPELNLEYFAGNNNGSDRKTYHGFQVGLAFPLWLPAKNAAVKAEKINTTIAQQQASASKAKLKTSFFSKQKAFETAVKNLDYQRNSGKKLIDELAFAAEKTLETGEINSIEYLYVLDQLLAGKMTYLQTIHQFNASVIELSYFTNGQD